MPYRRRYPARRGAARRRYPARRRTPARRGRGRTTGPNYITRAPPIMFPSVKNCAFTFSSDKSMLVGPSSKTLVTFRANSLFDPDEALGGLQPRYYDTLVGANSSDAPYNEYMVRSVRATIYARNISITRYMFVSLTICPSTSSPPFDLDEARERSDTIVRCIAPIGSGNGQTKLVMTRRMNTLFGVKDIQDVSELRAAYNANPALEGRIFIQGYNPDDTVNTQGVNFTTRLTYYSTLTVKNDVLNST